MRMLVHKLLHALTAALELTSVSSPIQAQPADPRNPLVVAESFLAARNARDSPGASAFCWDPLTLSDADGLWTADAPATMQWLRRLTDTYVVDTLVRPIADNDAVVWVERLAPRRMPFRDALAQSVEVTVQVVVRDGKIMSYTALYPTFARVDGL
jgi:hypothetical protein